MTTFTRTNIARAAAIAAAASAIAVTTAVATPTTASPAPEPERPCFIVQPQSNIAADGPVPTCAIAG